MEKKDTKKQLLSCRYCDVGKAIQRNRSKVVSQLYLVEAQAQLKSLAGSSEVTTVLRCPKPSPHFQTSLFLLKGSKPLNISLDPET